jgi:hypothetical protein
MSTMSLFQNPHYWSDSLYEKNDFPSSGDYSLKKETGKIE